MWAWLACKVLCTRNSCPVPTPKLAALVQAFGTFSLTTRLDFKDNSFHLVLENNEYLEETANLSPPPP